MTPRTHRPYTFSLMFCCLVFIISIFPASTLVAATIGKHTTKHVSLRYPSARYHVQPGQQYTTGPTFAAFYYASHHATFLGTVLTSDMKDGWIVLDDGWTVASVGIITAGDITYSIAVYLRGQADLATGWRSSRRSVPRWHKAC